MDVITLASRKGGAGKSTLTAQLAAQAHALGKRVLVIDADPQGSLKLWHSRRTDGLPRLAELRAVRRRDLAVLELAVRLRGEISGFRGVHGSGHCYFTLKDDRARIDAVIWRTTLSTLRSTLAPPYQMMSAEASALIASIAG